MSTVDSPGASVLAPSENGPGQHPALTSAFGSPRRTGSAPVFARVQKGRTATFRGTRPSDHEDRHEVRVRGRTVELTPSEWALLVALAGSPGRVYSRIELINRTRGYEFASERTVDSHVKNLRRKIELDPREPRIIRTVLGVGYRLGLTRDD